MAERLRDVVDRHSRRYCKGGIGSANVVNPYMPEARLFQSELVSPSNLRGVHRPSTPFLCYLALPGLFGFIYEYLLRHRTARFQGLSGNRLPVLFEYRNRLGRK